MRAKSCLRAVLQGGLAGSRKKREHLTPVGAGPGTLAQKRKSNMFVAMVKRGILMLAGATMLAFFVQIPLALAACPQGEGACPQNLGGGCAPMGSVCCPGGTHVASGGTCAAEQPGDWGAIAVVTWTDGSGAHVATGVSSSYKTISLASSSAL